MKIFNDPIHGRIEIPDYCVAIIDSIPFQRLRNLKQLGLTHHVFYGATHTRFEHSIGVSWLCGEWAKHFQRKHPELGITDIDIKTVQLAGLLHDIGHGPFSHTFEHLIKMTRPNVIYNHEYMTIKIIKKLYKIDVEKDICKIIGGIPLDKNPFLGLIVHNYINGLDADKLDYFIRDSQCTSFAIGCDWKRIIYESSIKDNEIVFPYKMVGDIFNVYQTRFRLYKEVYYHKTVRQIEEKVLKILIKAEEYGVSNLSKSIDNIETFITTTDDIIVNLEHCGISEIEKSIRSLKDRTFEYSVIPKRVAHYGLHELNPLSMVRFINKSGEYQQIDNDIIDSMCPKKFALLV